MSRLRLALCAILLGALVQSSSQSASAASISGTKCSKVNSTKIIAFLKFTCVKSGKKFIWNKGVTIKVAQSPAPSSTPTPTPAPTPTTPYANYTKIEREVYLAMEQIVNDWQPFLKALDNNNVKVITEKSGHPRNEPNRISVEISSEIIKSMLSTMIVPTYYTYETAAWADKQMESVCPVMVGRNPVGLNGGAQVGCGKLITSNLNGWNNKIAGIDGSWFEAAHETFHISQYVAGIVKNDPNNSLWYPNHPAWFREGSASTFGGLVRVLISKGRIDYSELNNFEKSPTSYSECKKAWETWKISSSATGQFDLGQCEYGLGRRMTDYLVAMHGGISGILKNYQYVADGKSFEEAFKLAHGLTLKEYFEEVKPFLAAQGFVIPT